MLTPGQMASLGVPKVLNILYNWSISESPGKNGILFDSSANIAPTDQMSTAVEYSNVPNKISGARYQSVITSWV